MSAPEEKPGLVKRAVESANDKLSRSRSALVGGSSSSSRAQPSSPPSTSAPLSSSPPQSASRRLFSLSRKSRHAGAEDGTTSENPSTRRSSVPAESDDPFIRPRTPPASTSTSSPHRTSRLSLAHSYHPRSQHGPDTGFGWDGYASMRAGTQTLIQALQAIPWSEDADAEDQDEHLHDHDQDMPSSPVQAPIDDENSDDESTPPLPMFSSIHTIHRPVALSKRSTAISSSLGTPTSIPEDESVGQDMGGDAEDDFEAGGEAPSRPAKQTKNEAEAAALITEGKGKAKVADLNAQTRSNPMGTVRVQRRAALAEKLRDVFEVPGIDEVIAEMPCWLLRSVMLQGFMYLTNSYLCFFAHLPATEQDQVLKSGFMSKKASRTRRWIKHWFILKNNTLSWYQSAADPYFPHGVIDLRYALSIDTPTTHPTTISIRTSSKTVSLSCATAHNASEWLKALKRATFTAQHSGETVRVALPYTAILDVERSSVLDFSDTLEVKVVDPTEHGTTFSVDSYFFAYFPDLDRALEMIRSAVRAHRANAPGPSSNGGENTLPVMDTTQPQPRSPNTFTSNLPPSENDGSTPPARPSTTSMFRLPSLWPRSHTTPNPTHASTTPSPSTPAKPPTLSPTQEDFTHISTRGPRSFVPLTTSPRPISAALPSSPGSTPPAGQNANPNAAGLPQSGEDLESSAHTYPPSPTPSETLQSPTGGSATAGGSIGGWSVGVPSWLRIGRASLNVNVGGASSGSGGRQSTIMSDGTAGSGHGQTYGHGHHEAVYSILETPGLPVDGEMQDKFRSYFALGEEEEVLGYFPGFIYRVIPVPGRLYISTNFFCFKSTGPLSSKTRMIIPLRDVLSTEPGAPWVLNHHGLVVNLRGYEELFFEFSALERRAAFVRLLDSRKDALAKIIPSSTIDADAGSLARGPFIHDDFEPGSHDTSSISPTSSTELGASAHERMFTSQSSTFLRFKPDRPLHFTFLTIGSRGDVQPYIALAKGLQADGHRVRIATHGEFREWIEGQGIEYGYVGGDPAELMKLSVENGMFTVSFLKEGLQKFRGWLDDLMETSWEACQGTDVLVESPSAMSGYHIAEALQIPYFRAFTMTWTRTRAYPHAFAVPDHKRGGTYNYMSYVLFDQVFWRAIAGQVNRWRRKTLGLGATNLDLMEPHKIPFLYNFSPTIVPPPLDWPDWIRITGYWFLESADVSKDTWTRPADVVRFIDDAHAAGKKVVYVGFGSIVVSDPKGMTKVIVEAIVRSGVHAILSKGWSDRLQTKGTDTEPEVPLPPQIFSVSSIPHDWLFQRIDAACHHGGAGTTGASLRAGVPTIIKPFFGDQFFWADRVEALGIGSGVRNLTVEALAEALHTATTDAKTVERAKVIGARIRAENGVASAVQAIYRDLDYARSLIKHKPDHTERAADDATIREATRNAEEGSDRSHSPPPESEWSVIEDGEGVSPSRRSSSRRRPSLGLRRGSSGQKESPGLSKRLVSAMTDVLPSPTKSRKSTV